MNDLPEYRLDRTFQAPLDIVWSAWTDPELLQRWYGPGIETIIHAFDLRAGGSWLNEMKWGEKSDFSKMFFQEVANQEKLVWHHSSTDADWNVISNPMMADWPKFLLTIVTFDSADEETNVCLTQTPIDATDTEIACFANTMAGMDQGWGGGYKIIDEILAELKA